MIYTFYIMLFQPLCHFNYRLVLCHDILLGFSEFVGNLFTLCFMWKAS